ncbi:MAG: M23 family metallopeptidase [Pleurocapsa sp.]
MTRAILLGLLATAIIPITFADAIATSNTKVVFSRSKNKNFYLDNSCTSFTAKSYCVSSSTSNVDEPEISSGAWLKDVAAILLSGSMFQKCRPNVEKKQYFEQNSDRRLLQNLTDPKCIFSWQNSFDSPVNVQDRGQTLVSNNPTNNSTQPQALLKKPKQFPKLSRSSLIVSFPTADSTFQPENTKLANPAPKTKRIASPFGWRRRPYSYQLQFHQGIDYGAPLGSPVVAVGDGIVTRVVDGCYDFGNLFCGGQLGNWIEIDHGNGTLGTYGHLKNSSITIKEGMKVWKNQQIAQVGSSGWSTGAHLDFRLKVNGKYEDPAQHLNPPDFSEL